MRKSQNNKDIHKKSLLPWSVKYLNREPRYKTLWAPFQIFLSFSLVGFIGTFVWAISFLILGSTRILGIFIIGFSLTIPFIGTCLFFYFWMIKPSSYYITRFNKELDKDILEKMISWAQKNGLKTKREGSIRYYYRKDFNALYNPALTQKEIREKFGLIIDYNKETAEIILCSYIISQYHYLDPTNPKHSKYSSNISTYYGITAEMLEILGKVEIRYRTKGKKN